MSREGEGRREEERVAPEPRGRRGRGKGGREGGRRRGGRKKEERAHQLLHVSAARNRSLAASAKERLATGLRTADGASSALIAPRSL